jgi:sulfur-carrier protein adenylyltransferase/sulfurtransferase
MNVLNYFKPVVSMTADEAREFIKGKNPGDFNLIDVRQPMEYELRHLAGAQLIPVGELQEHLKEVDKTKPTITY